MGRSRNLIQQDEVQANLKKLELSLMRLVSRKQLGASAQRGGQDHLTIHVWFLFLIQAGELGILIGRPAIFRQAKLRVLRLVQFP